MIQGSIDQPLGLCQCGCGLATKIAARNDKTSGDIKGQPKRFLRGHNRRRPLADRLWEKIEVGGQDDCWLFVGSRDSDGYGHIFADGALKQAHRLVFELCVGPLAEGEKVLHSCDNPPCCNPRHLFAGTQADNMADMMMKGRHTTLRGEDHGSARLTNDQVLMIVEMAESGTKRADIAEKFGVGLLAVYRILSGERWGHLTGRSKKTEKGMTEEVDDLLWKIVKPKATNPFIASAQAA